MTATAERRICWPRFDATCLEGGCLFCNDHPFRSVEAIRRAAERLGATSNRGDGRPRDATEAFHVGERHGWYNAESRVR